MSDLIKKPYEISLWEDVLTYIDSTGQEYVNLDETVKNQIIAQYYDEKKIAILGSNTMSTPIRAVENKLISNVNGSNTLTFSLYQKYRDEETGEWYTNPYISLLTNESKIKLRYGPEENCKWYHLVIKNIQEDSKEKKFTYTAKDQFVNELSKSGFSLTFDTKLENNTGTIKELGQKVLEGSDWRIAEGECSTLLQYIEEPLYEVVLKKGRILKGKDMLTGATISIPGATVDKEGNEINNIIYVFYHVLSNKMSSFQFLYSDSYKINENRVIINAPASDFSEKGSNYLIEYNGDYTETEQGNLPDFAISAKLISHYRGARLVRKAKTIYDKVLDKYVYTYKKGNNEYYGYTETEYIEPMAVENYVTNGSDFKANTDGWLLGGVLENGDTVYPTLEAITYPDIYNNIVDDFEQALKFNFSKLGQKIYNSGFSDNRSIINNIAAGDKFVFRIELKTLLYNKLVPVGKEKSLIRVKIGEYNLTDGVYTLKNDETYFDFSDWENKEVVEEDLNIEGNKIQKSRTFCYAIASCKKSLSYSDLISKNIGIFIEPASSDFLGKTWYLTEAQFFPYLTYDNNGTNEICVPGVLIDPRVETRYYYYVKNPAIVSPDEIVYTYRGIENDPSYILVYNDTIQENGQIEVGYEKIRSIKASESNRFNLIQTLCETFECWADFKISTTPQGKIKTVYAYEKNIETDENKPPKYQYLESEVFLTDRIADCIGKRQVKEIAFKEYVGQENWAGFKYGINLSSIIRTIDSEGFVSKIIVKDNSNEHGKDGRCSIVRAKANPSSENFLYDFTYYINQGMLSVEQVDRDLYGPNINGNLAYYKKLSAINIDRDTLIQEGADISRALDEAETNITSYKSMAHEQEEQITSSKVEIESTTDFTFSQFKNITIEQTAQLHTELILAKIDYNNWIGLTVNSYEALKIINSEIAKKFEVSRKGSYADAIRALDIVQNYKTWKEDNYIKSLCVHIIEAIKAKNSYNKLYNTAVESKKVLEQKYETVKTQLNKKALQKEHLNKAFYHKYSRFIQEGSWISEDYMDDELYYMDSESTLHASAQPKVSYDIKVLEISQLEEFKNYTFALGDRTYIEDTEFFGWNIDPNTNLKQPYKEEVVVVEITISLDDPTQNNLKIQNYKTQFEDLFQRIAAATQSIEYSTGKYEKAAGIVEPNGTINIATLQNSLANNSVIITNSKDQSVVWDETGITTTCLTKPNEVVRIVSGGIFLSKDGGHTWRTGITGSGINANYITTGCLDVNLIRIMNGIHTSFKWDNLGITAYKFKPSYNANGVINGGSEFRAGVFTRFDQYGIYGINGNENFDASVPDANGKTGEDKIWDSAKFALTWKGFSLRSDGERGFVRISSDKDIQVLTNINGKLINRIHIGDLSEGAGLQYGLRIKDKDDNTVMETDDNGMLYLKKYMRVGPDSISETRDRVKFGIVKNYKITQDGFLESESADFSTISKILSIKDTDAINTKADTIGLEENEVLSIYDDGTLVAKRVIIDGGRIGNMSIQDIEGLNLKVAIEVVEGNDTIFKNATDRDYKKLRAYLRDLNGENVSFTDKTVSYRWSIDGVVNNNNASEQIIYAEDITSSTGAALIRCYITVTDPTNGQTLTLA